MLCIATWFSTALLALSVNVPLAAEQEGLEYANAGNHFTLRLPIGWKEIPKTKIDDTINKMMSTAKGAQVQRPEYIAGFQRADRADFKYPYILMQQHDGNTPSYAQIEKELASDKVEKGVADVAEKFSTVLSNAVMNKPILDKQRHIIFVTMEMDVKVIGKVKGYTAMCLGKKGMTQINYYTLEKEAKENLSLFEQVVKSFHFESEYQYREIKD